MIVRTDYQDQSTPTGPMRVHVYAPVASESRRFPGLLLYPEIFQQTGPIARLSTMFASHGYVVMAPEIYHEHEPPGTVLAYDDVGKTKGNAYKKTTPLSTFDSDARTVVAALRQHPLCNGRIGTAGFCIGGHLAFRAALDPEILAACCFYPTDLHSGALGEGEHADTLSCRRDEGRTGHDLGTARSTRPSRRTSCGLPGSLRGRLRFSWHEVNGEHAFMRDEGERYDAEAARLCMGIALALFQRTL